MAKPNVYSIISANCITAVCLLCISQLGEIFTDRLSITLHPFFATKIYIITISLLSLLGAWIQGAKPARAASIWVSSGLIFASSIAFHMIAVMFGAPFLSAIPETYHFACLISAATILPSFLVLGPYQENWVQMYAQHNPNSGVETNVWTTTACCILGGWLGALPIPLDWDRPWQKWPITCIIGALYGYIIGLILASVYVLFQDRKSGKSKSL